ncbi:MAG: HD domain-containing protein [Dysgonamonadaceae bacterium]
MNLYEQLNRAIEIAIKVHEGQTDLNGQPYIGHPFRVMAAGHTLQEKIVGVLHDVIEDSDWTIEDLTAEGFSKEIVDGVDGITKREGEKYKDYLLRVENNSIAVRVKMNDLTDNMDIRRLDELTEEHINRMRKYLKAYKQLTEKE